MIVYPHMQYKQPDFQVHMSLPGHEGPVSSLSFSPTQPLLASCSWDKTVRTWDVFDGKGTTEALPHNQVGASIDILGFSRYRYMQ